MLENGCLSRSEYTAVANSDKIPDIAWIVDRV